MDSDRVESIREADRESRILRAEMKRQVRKEGIRFDDGTFREIGQRIKDINESGDLRDPLTFAEALELYLKIFRELVEERTRTIEKRIQAEKADKQITSVGFRSRRTVPGNVPGPAFIAGGE